MIRVLFLIAAAGFMVAVVAISAAIAIGGPEVIARGAWSMGSHDAWDWDGDHDDHGHRRDRVDGSGPQTTRELAWTGGDSLDLEVPADVEFTQAIGPGKLTITGPKGSVEQVVLEDGHLRFDRRVRNSGRMTIVMSAPGVTRFDLGGSNRVTIDGYDQDRLAIDLSGNSELVAKGRAKVVELDISGSGEADLGELASEGAEVDISGSGEATVAPKDWATLEITGSGEVNLLTNPARLETDITGSGRIRQGSQSPSTPPPSPVPGKKT